jgi:capsule polysaccharide export protein KpsE/RkpR
LRLMTNTLAVSEAQQRRKFFEQKLDETKSKLTDAQIALQSSGFSPGTLKVEPRTAAEGYARARAEVTAAEVKLQTLRRMLADGAPEVSQQQALLGALRAELSKLEQKEPAKGDADYIGRYRDFKYQETLFDLYAKQFELARTDESREGALIQVVDVATPPEKKSKPKRGAIAVGVAVIFAFVLVIRAVVIGARGSRESLT